MFLTHSQACYQIWKLIFTVFKQNIKVSCCFFSRNPSLTRNCSSWKERRRSGCKPPRWAWKVGLWSSTCRGEFATRALTLRLELALLSCNLQFCLDPNVLCCYKWFARVSNLMTSERGTVWTGFSRLKKSEMRWLKTFY